MPGANASPLPFLFFVISAFGGYLCVDLFHKWNQRNLSFENLQTEVEDLRSLQEAQQMTLTEHSERIREKQDYDETSEVEQDVFQAWRGDIDHERFRMKITIWRVKKSTIQKNQEWTGWNGLPDASSIVRDFYLGNSNPEFPWKETDTCAEVDETLINGWESIIRVTIVLEKKEDLLPFLYNYPSNGMSIDYNLLLKKCVNEGLIQWSRVLIPS